MTSATTSTNGRARLAASSLLALAMMLGGCAAAPTGLREVIAEAQVRVHAVETDLHRLEPQVATLPAGLRTDVTSAVASAEAAIEEAGTALAQAARSDETAVVALADAQVALDAVSAELRYVIAEAGGADVATALERLAVQIDALRGEAHRAVV